MQHWNKKCTKDTWMISVSMFPSRNGWTHQQANLPKTCSFKLRLSPSLFHPPFLFLSIHQIGLNSHPFFSLPSPPLFRYLSSILLCLSLVSLSSASFSHLNSQVSHLLSSVLLSPPLTPSFSSFKGMTFSERLQPLQLCFLSTSCPDHKDKYNLLSLSRATLYTASTSISYMCF